MLSEEDNVGLQPQENALEQVGEIANNGADLQDIAQTTYKGAEPQGVAHTAYSGAEPQDIAQTAYNGAEPQDIAQTTYSGAEVAALQELVHQKIGSIPLETEEPLPDPESIERISTDKIKAMRRLSVDKSETLPPFQEQLAETLIRCYSNFKTFFMPPAKERRYCELKGHECKHCGEIVESLTQKSQREKQDKLRK